MEASVQQRVMDDLRAAMLSYLDVPGLIERTVQAELRRKRDE